MPYVVSTYSLTWGLNRITHFEDIRDAKRFGRMLLRNMRREGSRVWVCISPEGGDPALWLFEPTDLHWRRPSGPWEADEE